MQAGYRSRWWGSHPYPLHGGSAPISQKLWALTTHHSQLWPSLENHHWSMGGTLSRNAWDLTLGNGSCKWLSDVSGGVTLWYRSCLVALSEIKMKLDLALKPHLSLASSSALSCSPHFFTGFLERTASITHLHKNSHLRLSFQAIWPMILTSVFLWFLLPLSKNSHC